MYVLGCRLSLVRLCDIDFGITPVDDITIGITCAASCFHIAHVSFASSWYLFCLSVIFFLARLCVFGTAMSIKKAFFVFLLYLILIIILIIIIIPIRLSLLAGRGFCGQVYELLFVQIKRRLELFVQQDALAS